MSDIQYFRTLVIVDESQPDIPKNYVVRVVLAKHYDAALSREDALREDLDNVRDLHSKQCCVFCSDTGNLWAVHADLQQRLTVAEQRAGELEGLLHMSKELLTTISRHGASTMPVDWCDSFKAEVADRIEKIGAALKPAAGPHKCIECESQYCHGVCVERGDDDERYKGAEGEGS